MKDKIFLENNLSDCLPLYFNFVRYEIVPKTVVRIDFSYYDKRFYRRRDALFHNEFLRILE